MNHCIKNSISDFDFHDSEVFDYISDKNNLTLFIKHLNVKKNTNENPFDYHMEIDVAKLTFFNLSFVSFKPGDTWAQDDNGVMQCVKKAKKYSGKRGAKRFINEMASKFCINCFSTESIPDLSKDAEVFSHKLSCIGYNEPYFDVILISDAFSVEWDNYLKKAWYEYTKQSYESVVIQAYDTDIKEKVHTVAHFDDEGMVTSASVSITIDDDRLIGIGNNKEYAILNLISQFPDTIKLKACMTCRHGNFCPIGDNEDEIFCMKDIVPKQKSDLFYYTEDDKERADRVRKLLYVCDDYKPMEKDFYTYNDYYLNNLQKGEKH